jgi:hypothetical protein
MFWVVVVARGALIFTTYSLESLAVVYRVTTPAPLLFKIKWKNETSADVLFNCKTPANGVCT